MIELEHRSGIGTFRVITEGEMMRIMKTTSIGQTSVELHGLEIEMLEEVLKQKRVKEKVTS